MLIYRSHLYQKVVTTKDPMQHLEIVLPVAPRQEQIQCCSYLQTFRAMLLVIAEPVHCFLANLQGCQLD